MSDTNKIKIRLSKLIIYYTSEASLPVFIFKILVGS